MDKRKADSMFDLLDATSNLVLTHKENFKIVEKEINSLKNCITAQTTLISFMVGLLSVSSDSFKTSFEGFAEKMLLQKDISPEFAAHLRGILSGINGNQPEPPEKPIFVLHHGGKENQGE